MRLLCVDPRGARYRQDHHREYVRPSGLCAGRKILFLAFEESAEAIIANMLSPGIDLRPALQAGTLRFLTAMPEAMGAEEHLFCALRDDRGIPTAARDR